MVLETIGIYAGLPLFCVILVVGVIALSQGFCWLLDWTIDLIETRPRSELQNEWEWWQL